MLLKVEGSQRNKETLEENLIQSPRELSQRRGFILQQAGERCKSYKLQRLGWHTCFRRRPSRDPRWLPGLRLVVASHVWGDWSELFIRWKEAGPSWAVICCGADQNKSSFWTRLGWRIRTQSYTVSVGGPLSDAWCKTSASCCVAALEPCCLG